MAQPLPRIQQLLALQPDASTRSTYTYYNRPYSVPAVGDIVRSIHTDSAADKYAMVTGVVKKGHYKVIRVVAKNKGFLTSRADLTIPSDAIEYIWLLGVEKRSDKDVYLEIVDLPLQPIVEDTNAKITSAMVKTLYSTGEVAKKVSVLRTLYQMYLEAAPVVVLSENQLYVLLFGSMKPFISAGEYHVTATTLESRLKELVVTNTNNSTPDEIHQTVRLLGYRSAKTVGITLPIVGEFIDAMLTVLDPSDDEIMKIIDASPQFSTTRSDAKR